MQKNRNRVTSSAPVQQVRAPRRYPVSFPETTNIDVLSIVTDEELISRFRSIDDDRIKVLDAHLDPRQWEEEIAYLRREMQIRRSRREAHERYSRQLEREYADSEVGLPQADLDNSHFLRLVGEIS